MKRSMTMWMAIATLLLLGAGAASAQSLGDYARAAKKNKPQVEKASRHYDNDNLPTTEQLSVVGPEPQATSEKTKSAATDSKAGATDSKVAEEERRQAVEEMQKKIETEKEKVDSLTRELDLAQREYRLRASAYYADAGARLRNAAQWEKDDAQYKSDTDYKEKALAAARQQLSDLQEQARKAGVREQENDPEKGKK